MRHFILSSRLRLIVVVAVLLLAAAPVGIFASRNLLPGAPETVQIGQANGLGQAVSASAVVDGRSLTLTNIVSDAEQTAISYAVVPSRGDGPFVTIAPRPRLALSDGTLVPFVSNNTDPATSSAGGTLIFGPVPNKVATVRLEVDGLEFQNDSLAKQFSITVNVDPRPGYEGSVRTPVDLRAGSGTTLVHVSEISQTPTSITVRGTFEGLIGDDIAQLGPPHYTLRLADGSVVASESGRRGFGPNENDFEIRFPNHGSLAGSTLIFDHGTWLPGSPASRTARPSLEPVSLQLQAP